MQISIRDKVNDAKNDTESIASSEKLRADNEELDILHRLYKLDKKYD